MPIHVALLRGTNLGAHHRLPTKTLRDMLSTTGGSGIRTLPHSGNALCDHTGTDPA